MEILFLFFSENMIWNYMQTVSFEEICMNVKSCFLGKNKKKIPNLLSAELAQKVIKIE